MGNKFKSAGKTIPIEEAIGTVLAHDITEIKPGSFKGTAFKKGHIIRQKDLDHLKRIGKEHLFVLKLGPGEVHEDDAAVRLATALAGPGVVFDKQPSEGKIALKAAFRGLLKVDIQSLKEFNMVDNISCSSKHTNTLLEKGEILAATRAIPLIIDDLSITRAEEIAKKSPMIFTVKELSTPETGIIITGTEVYSGRTKDHFAPIIKQKLNYFGCNLKEIIFLPDDRARITEEIKILLEKNINLILVTGGMSVDPDDVTRTAIEEAGVEDIVYGTPVNPGAMFLYGRIGAIPVLGLPACVIYYKTTVLDLLFPRVLAGETITREDLASLGHGGLCLNCEKCRYPVCPFGK